MGKLLKWQVGVCYFSTGDMEMGLRNWYSLTLRGENHVIPPVCPNCLAPANVALRYGHRNVLFMLIAPWVGTYQSFHYCPTCAVTAEAHIRNRRLIGFFAYGLTGMFTTLPLFGFPAALAGIIAGIALSEIAPEIAVWFGFVLAFTLFGLEFWLFARWLKGRAMRRYPQREGQAVWGLAAYAVEGGHFLGQYGVYKAARSDWIQALAEANPDLLDDAAYLKLFGIRRPPPAEKPRPFA